MSTTVSVCFSLLLSLIVGSQAAVIERGDCPKVTVVNPFDISAYLGDWYELQKFPAPLIEPNLKCVKAQYTLRDGHTVRVNNTGFDKKTGAYSEALGNATAEDPTIGSLRVSHHHSCHLQSPPLLFRFVSGNF